MENKFYVYTHRRLDTGEVFYVGKGSGRRAWSSYKRNDWWTNVANKAGFDVEILADGLEEAKAFEVEKQLISLFKKLGLSLTNLSEGGEGNAGYKYEGEKLDRLRNHIEKQWKKLSDPCNYTFYNFTGEKFTGTRVQFSEKYDIHSKEVAKLFQSKATRSIVKNWSLSPFEVKTNKKKILVCPQRRSSNVDTNVYTFYHILGDNFLGTRTEFSDYSQIELAKIAGLFCKNPRRTVYGWSLNKMKPTEYTHLKI